METDILKSLEARPSISEEHGISLLKDTDLLVFSPGISTAGSAEIRMAKANLKRHVVATTIDQKGLDFAKKVIEQTGLSDKVEPKLEDLRGKWTYPENYFDFIYARLVLHYLSAQDLDKVLQRFHKSLKQAGTLFVVVRSEKNVDRNDPNLKFDQETQLTTVPYYDNKGNLENSSKRYFHTPESITEHLKKAGFKIKSLDEYQEQLYKDFARKEISPIKDHIIEVVAAK